MIKYVKAVTNKHQVYQFRDNLKQLQGYKTFLEGLS